jgi:hypothetical protein
LNERRYECNVWNGFLHICFNYAAGHRSQKEIVNTGCMTEIAERRVWTPRHIEAACQKWYSPVLRAFNTVCPSTRIKVRDECYWWDNDCEKAKKEVHAADRHAHRNANNKQKPNGQDWAEFKKAGRAYKKTIWKAKEHNWHKYVSKVEKLPDMAKLSKVLQSKLVDKLGMVRKPDGSTCCSADETLEVMLREHFPGSTITELEAPDPEPTFERLIEPIPWITPSRIKEALHSFGPHKATGPDSLKPIVLQHLPEAAIEALTRIYMAVVDTGYTPRKWRESNVIFLAKPGKTDMADPRSF